MLGIVRLVVCGRDVVPSFGDVAVLSFHFGGSNFETFCDDLLVVVLGLAVLLLCPAFSVDFCFAGLEFVFRAA